MLRSTKKQFWKKVFWANETKINLIKALRREGPIQDPNCTTWSVNNSGGAVMAWAWMTATGARSLVTESQRSCNSSSFPCSLVFYICFNLVSFYQMVFIYTAVTSPDGREKEMNYDTFGYPYTCICSVMAMSITWPESCSCKAARNVCQSTIREEIQHLVIFMGSRLQAVMDCKRCTTK